MNLRDAALELAAQGVAVFPCAPDKSPLVSGGFHSASSDEHEVYAMPWERAAMIGAAIRPGVVVIDVDPRNGGDQTMGLFPELPPTYRVGTKSGGWHYYLSVPEDVMLRAHLGPGVDVKRAGKGYVIVPPSPGYEAAGFMEADAPQWLLDELTVPDAPEGTGEASDPKFFPWEDGTAYGLAALERELGRLATAPEGGRNDALNRAAFGLAQLVAGGELDHDKTLDALLNVAERIGLEPGEIEKTTASGWRKGEAEPRQAPAQDSATVPVPARAGTEPEAERRFWVDWETEEPAPPFYLHPLLPKHAYVLVYGATEASKSMAWVGLLCEGSHRGVRTSVYSLENPPHTDRDRLRRWAPNPDNFRLTNELLDLNDARQLGAMMEREKDWGDGRGTDVVLIDTYSHAFSSRSEDGNAKAIEFAVRMRHLMKEVGCSVVLIDHTGYAQEDEPRDASAKRQQVDVAILMKKAGEWRPGQPARFTMSNKKAARFGNPFLITGEIRDSKSVERGLELGWMGERPRWEPGS